MAARKPTYDPEREYDVLLNRVVMLGVVKLLPRNRHTMAGTLLNDLGQVPAEAVDEALVIEPKPARVAASGE